MGVDSGVDDGLSLSDEEDESWKRRRKSWQRRWRRCQQRRWLIELAWQPILESTNVVDGVGGVGLVNAEEVSITTVPPLQNNTQQSTKGSFWHVLHYQQTHQHFLFSPDAMLHPQ